MVELHRAYSKDRRLWFHHRLRLFLLWIYDGQGSARRRRSGYQQRRSVFSVDHCCRRSADQVHLLPLPGNGHMSETQTIAVEFKHVMKSFGPKCVLNDVSFHIDQGQALCLLGRSGTGKSVTLKLIMALMRPDSGEVWVDQNNVVGMGEKHLSLVRRKMGYLFQDAALFDSLTLYENLALPLSRLTKKSKDEIDDVVHRVLIDVGLGTDSSKYPSALSGGMKKRAGLARALVLEPKILLADEPGSGLDRITASEIDELLIRRKADHGTALIIVTHDVHGTRRIADRVAVLDKGRLVAFGAVEEVSQSDNEVARRLITE